MPISHRFQRTGVQRPGDRRDGGNVCKARFRRQGGFSVVELIIAGVIILVLAAFAIPAMVSSVRTAHLRGAASDMAGLYEQARINAIRDNRYYATYVLA